MIGGNPIYNASRGDTVNSQMMTFMENVFEWLLDEDELGGINKYIAIGHMGGSEESAVKEWLLNRSDSSIQITIGCSADSLNTCLNKDIDLLVVASDDMGGSDFDLYADQIQEAMSKGLPLLYMVRTGSNKNLAKSLNPKLNTGYMWHNYFKHLGLMNFDPTQDNSVSSPFSSITKVLKHFEDGDYAFYWSGCSGNSCSDVEGYQEEFLSGVNQIRSLFTSLDKNNQMIFEDEGSRIYKHLALLGDKFRSQIAFPMDKESSEEDDFLKSLYADYSVYQSRKIQYTQSDLGNFSRTDFSQVTPVMRDRSYLSKKNFRAAGVYMIPGQKTMVVRKDNSLVSTKISVNTQRSSSTKEYETDKYVRPKYLKGQGVSIAPGDTIWMSSPYGGPIQIEFGSNGDSVRFEFHHVGLHPIWRCYADNGSFAERLNQGDFDWAEIITDGFEVHSQLEKMRSSIENERFPSAKAIAGATEEYMSNLPHVLAGFKGPGIDSIPEIHAFAENNGMAIQFTDIVKHMNADQATCGSGCSGNPYDAFWAFNPTGYGDIHELGHGLEKGRFKFTGWESHSHTNYYSYFSKSTYLDSAGGDSDCQSLKFEELYADLQQSFNEPDPFAYMNSKDYNSWSWGASIMIQMFMMAEQEAVVSDGWYLLTRLHIIERAYGVADNNEASWDSLKVGMGYDQYAYADIGNITQNDWLAIALSKSMERNLVDYLTMWGIELSTEAIAQINSFGYAQASRVFFGANDSDYCTDFQPDTLALDGTSGWLP